MCNSLPMRHLEVQVLALGFLSLEEMGLGPAISVLLLLVSWNHRAGTTHRLED